MKAIPFSLFLMLVTGLPKAALAQTFDIWWHTTVMTEADLQNDLVILHDSSPPPGTNAHLTIEDFFNPVIPPGVHACAGASTTDTIQTIPSSAYYTPVFLNQTLSQTDQGMHSQSNLLDNSKLFVQSPGVYTFEAVVELDTGSLPEAAYPYGISVEKTTVTGSSQMTVTIATSENSTSTTIRRLQLNGTVWFPASLNYGEANYLQLKAFQESGNDIPLKVDGLTPRFSLRKLSGL